MFNDSAWSLHPSWRCCHAICLTQVAMSFPDAFSSGQDGLVRRWSLQDSCCLQEFQAHQDAVRWCPAECPAEWVALVISGGSNWFPPTILFLYIVFICFHPTSSLRIPDDEHVSWSWNSPWYWWARYDGTWCSDWRLGGAWRWIGSRNSCWLGVSIYPCDYGLSIPRCLDQMVRHWCRRCGDHVIEFPNWLSMSNIKGTIHRNSSFRVSL